VNSEADANDLWDTLYYFGSISSDAAGAWTYRPDDSNFFGREPENIFASIRCNADSCSNETDSRNMQLQKHDAPNLLTADARTWKEDKREPENLNGSKCGKTDLTSK
jgi:hypothetical protein